MDVFIFLTCVAVGAIAGAIAGNALANWMYPLD